MRFAKRFLALLLVISLGLGFAAHCFAEDDDVDGAMPVITKQPESAKVPLTQKRDPVTIEAYIPNGDAIGYQWYDASGKTPVEIEGATDSSMPIKYSYRSYYCVVYNQNDSTAKEGPHRVTSDVADGAVVIFFFDWKHPVFSVIFAILGGLTYAAWIITWPLYRLLELLLKAVGQLP